ncbi:hypothetical protein ACFE04_008169 [Oxalis oulophora]
MFAAEIFMHEFMLLSQVCTLNPEEAYGFYTPTEGADHFFVVPLNFGACFHYQDEKAIGRAILSLVQRTTLVQTLGQRNQVCLKEGSITVSAYAPPQKMQAHWPLGVQRKR